MGKLNLATCPKTGETTVILDDGRAKRLADVKTMCVEIGLADDRKYLKEKAHEAAQAIRCLLQAVQPQPETKQLGEPDKAENKTVVAGGAKAK